MAGSIPAPPIAGGRFPFRWDAPRGDCGCGRSEYKPGFAQPRYLGETIFSVVVDPLFSVSSLQKPDATCCGRYTKIRYFLINSGNPKDSTVGKIDME